MPNAKGFIQGMGNIQRKIDNINKKMIELQKEREYWSWLYRRLLNQEKKQHVPISMEDFASLISEDIRPEIIPVWERLGNKIILLRSPYMPEFAFLAWNTKSESINNTLCEINLNINGIPSIPFYIVCMCCFYMKPRELDEEGREKELEEFKKLIGNEFKEKLIDACKQNGIRVIFGKSKKDWKHGDLKEYGIGLYECSNYMQIMSISYSKNIVKKFLSFIDWKESTDIPSPCNCSIKEF